MACLSAIAPQKEINIDKRYFSYIETLLHIRLKSLVASGGNSYPSKAYSGSLPRLMSPNIALCRLLSPIVALCCLIFPCVDINIAQCRSELSNVVQYLVHILAKIN